MRKGICYLVGAGPGDPLLMTLKGREYLRKADVVVYDYLCNPVFLEWAPPGAELISAGKKCGAHVMPQSEINRLLVARTSAGKTVVRLKGGDPFLFGRGGEEATELADAGCAFEVVPGVSSAIAGAVYAGIPLTHRAHNTMVTIFTGHESPEKLKSSLDFSAIARAPGTKVMLMGIKRLAFVTKELLAEGMDKDLPVALVRWATTSRQETLVGTLSDIAQLAEKAGFKAPAVAIFGEVVTLRKKLNWFESLPLFGKTIAVPRSLEPLGDLVADLRALGADAFEMPITRIGPAPVTRRGAIADEFSAYQTTPASLDDAGVRRFLEKGVDLVAFTDSSAAEGFHALKLPAHPGRCHASICPITSKTMKSLGMSVDIEAHTLPDLLTAITGFYANPSLEDGLKG